MNSSATDLRNLPPQIFEAGLQSIGRAIAVAQSWLGAIDGTPPSHETVRPAVDGPNDIDRATSDFANRTARIIRYMAIAGPGGRSLIGEIADAARASFGGVAPRDARALLTFPVRLPLSFGSLIAQELVRSLHALEIVGTRKAPGFLIELVEAFLDYPIFQALQYKDEIERYRERLRQVP